MSSETQHLPIHPVLAEMAKSGPQAGEYFLRFKRMQRSRVLLAITEVLTPDLLGELGEYLVPHSNRTWMTPRDKIKYERYVKGWIQYE